MEAALQRILISDAELAPFGSVDALPRLASALLRQQMQTWELLRNNYASLDIVETKTFTFDGFVINVQFNPKRLTSSSAKVDDKSIRERRCFLCAANLPPEQRGFLYRDEYVFLCNPFPILPEHFTIPNREHRPQQIGESFEMFLQLAKDLAGDYTVIYNGPRAGASAPDHQHFQVGTRHVMPIDDEYQTLKHSKGELLVESSALEAFSVEHYLRRLFILEAADGKILTRAFDLFLHAFMEVTRAGEEPMMNLEAWYEDLGWRVAVFPRAKHRPSVFHAEGDRHMLLSPAAIDMGGICTTPLEKDFRKITKDNLVDMYDEVTLTAEAFAKIKNRMKEGLESVLHLR